MPTTRGKLPVQLEANDEPQPKIAKPEPTPIGDGSDQIQPKATRVIVASSFTPHINDPVEYNSRFASEPVPDTEARSKWPHPYEKKDAKKKRKREYDEDVILQAICY